MPPSSASGPPQIPHATLVQQEQGSAVMIWTIGAFVDPPLSSSRFTNKIYLSFCIFGWEWLLCLPKEYKRIWKKPLNVRFDYYYDGSWD